MIKRNLLWLGGLLVASGIACQFFQSTAQPWIPVMEETSFHYLNVPLDEAMVAVQHATSEVTTERYAAADQSLRDASRSLAKLRRFYVPLTEVRQLIYDADRLFYLKRYEMTRKKLAQAKAIMLNMASTGGPMLKTPVEEIIVALDDLLITIEISRDGTLEKLGALGHRVNLMLLRGELILADAKFNE